MPTDRTTPDVAADMERIFAPLAGRPIQVPANGGAARADDVPPPRPAGKGLLLVAPLLVLLAGGALASIYIGTGGTLTPPAPRTTAASAAPVADGGTGAGPEAVPVETATLDDGAPRTEQSIPAPTPQDETIAGDSALPAAPATAQRRRDRDGTEAADADGRARRGAGSSPSRTGCEPGSLDDQCIYQDVLNADGRLRRAFDRARRSGVPSNRLTTIQRQWISARDNADVDPDGTIRRYDRLADILDQEREEIME